MGTMASQITSLVNVYSTVYSVADQRKHQISASLAFVRRIHRGPVNSPHKWTVTRKMFPFDDVIMAMHNFVTEMCTAIDLLQNICNAPFPYPTMHNFVTEMCPCGNISVTKCCIVGYMSNALWDWRDGSIHLKIGWQKNNTYWKLRAITMQNYNPRCRQLRQSWHHNNYWFSMSSLQAEHPWDCKFMLKWIPSLRANVVTCRGRLFMCTQQESTNFCI